MQQPPSQIQKTAGSRKDPTHPLHRKPLHQGHLWLPQDSGWGCSRCQRGLRWGSVFSWEWRFLCIFDIKATFELFVIQGKVGKLRFCSTKHVWKANWARVGVAISNVNSTVSSHLSSVRMKVICVLSYVWDSSKQDLLLSGLWSSLHPTTFSTMFIKAAL